MNNKLTTPEPIKCGICGNDLIIVDDANNTYGCIFGCGENVEKMCIDFMRKRFYSN